MKFSKMHGCGNDYIYINCFEENIPNPEELAVKLSDRHFGIGGDGIILICPSKEADFEMKMYNADGSRAEMCGNGIRCVAKYVYDKGLTDKTSISIVSCGKIKYLELTVENQKVQMVRVNMGAPVLAPEEIPVIWEDQRVVDIPVYLTDAQYQMTCVSMGNPHGVIFIEDEVKDFPVEVEGPKLECHPMFPKKANIEFIKIKNRKEMDMRVWERGTGETLACGTGTCASVVAAILNGLTDHEVLVHLLGGDLKISWTGNAEDPVFMTGPATFVFDGEIDI